MALTSCRVCFVQFATARRSVANRSGRIIWRIVDVPGRRSYSSEAARPSGRPAPRFPKPTSGSVTRIQFREMALRDRVTEDALIADSCGLEPARVIRAYGSFLNSSTLSPASRTMPPRVTACAGLFRGMVTSRTPLDITICLPSRTILKPAPLLEPLGAAGDPGDLGQFRLSPRLP